MSILFSKFLTGITRNLKNIHPPRFGAHSLADGCILPFNLFVRKGGGCVVLHCNEARIARHTTCENQII
jgi:hypothetical protein